MNKKMPLYELPVVSAGLLYEAVLCGNVIRYGHVKDDVELKGGIAFGGLKATRTRSESACTAWHIEEAYDILVEVQPSEWVEEIMSDTQDRRRRFGETWDLHHYMIYLDSTGCIEVVANSWNALVEERGSWA